MARSHPVVEFGRLERLADGTGGRRLCVDNVEAAFGFALGSRLFLGCRFVCRDFLGPIAPENPVEGPRV